MALIFPANPIDGQFYDQYFYDAASESWRVYGVERALSLIPTGAMMMWYTDTPPVGWLLCNGQSTSGYAELASIVGPSVPNLQGRVPVGKDSTQTEFNFLGATGGAKTHTLTTPEMPSHTHTQNAHSHTQGRGNDNNLGGGAGQYGWQSTDDKSGAFATSSVAATNQNTGGGQPHNNLQPYIVLNYIIKT
jgi:microcystin-dependent protein